MPAISNQYSAGREKSSLPMSARQPIVNEIATIVRRYPADCQPTRVESLGSAGGLSGARFWRIVAPRGVLVLRRWPTEHPTPERLQFIHAVLQHAASRRHEDSTCADCSDHRCDVRPPRRASLGTRSLAPGRRRLRKYLQASKNSAPRCGRSPSSTFRSPTSLTGLPLASSRGPAPAITHRLARLRELRKRRH